MKKTVFIIALMAGLGVFAQEQNSDETPTANKNIVETKTTTKTAVADNDGIEITTAEVTKKETQELALAEKTTGQNFASELGNKQIQTDATYDLRGTVYVFEPDGEGFNMVAITNEDSRKQYAKIRRTNQQGYFYIIAEGQPNAFAYYDEDGNFITETYNPKTDEVKVTTYSLKTGEKISGKKKLKELKKEENNEMNITKKKIKM